MSFSLTIYIGCHPGRSAARSGALQTWDPIIPVLPIDSAICHQRWGTWIPALALRARPG